MDIQKIDINSIVPNTWNPNVVDEKTQRTLMEDIKRDGFTQPIIVRAHPTEEGKYEIIDGEHRWQALKELAWTEVECIVETKNDAEAMIRTITMNKLRGEFDSLKLAEVLVELKKTYTEEELVVLLGFTEEEIRSYEELLDFDPSQLEALNNDPDIPDDLIGGENLVNDLTFGFTLTQLDMVESAIHMTGSNSPEVGITEICDAFLKNNFPDKHAEVLERAERLNAVQNGMDTPEITEEFVEMINEPEEEPEISPEVEPEEEPKSKKKKNK